MYHGRELKKASYFEREFVNAAIIGDAGLLTKIMELGVDIDARVSGCNPAFSYIIKTLDQKLISKALDLKPDLSHLISDEEHGNMTYIDWLFYHVPQSRWDTEVAAIFKRLASEGCSVNDYEAADAYFKNLSEEIYEECKTQIALVLERKMSVLKKQLKRALKKAAMLESGTLVFDIAGLIEKDAVDVCGSADLKFKELVKGTDASQIILKHKLGVTECAPNDYAVFEIGRAITQHKSCYA